MDEDIQVYKIVLIGSSATGKTNISTRYINNQFKQHANASVGVEFLTKKANIKGKDIKITLWDTAGQQRYKSLSKVYYKGARGILVVYDITNPQTYLDVQSWMRLANQTVNLSDITVFVVGNKIDLKQNQKVMTERVIKEYGQEFGLDCWQVSAKTGDKIQQMFQSLYQKIYLKGIQNQNSLFYGESELISQSDRQSFNPTKKHNVNKQKNFIKQVIIEEREDFAPSKQPHIKPEEYMMSRMTLTPEDQRKRMEEEKINKKKCCH